MAATSKNLKGTYKPYVREGAGMQAAAATELAKRVNVSSSYLDLEQENIRLRARLHDLEQRLVKVENLSFVAASGNTKQKPRAASPQKDNTSRCSSPVRGMNKKYGVSTRHSR